jgi:hypothetical protein
VISAWLRTMGICDVLQLGCTFSDGGASWALGRSLPGALTSELVAADFPHLGSMNWSDKPSLEPAMR